MTYRDRGDTYCRNCGRVIGWHAGQNCYPPTASGMPAPLGSRPTVADRRAAELEPELADELELEESGQYRLGSDGEQRAFQGLALELEPAPFLFSPDHHEEA